MKALLLESCPDEIKTIERKINSCCPSIELDTYVTDASEVLQIIDKQKPECIFLDGKIA